MPANIVAMVRWYDWAARRNRYYYISLKAVQLLAAGSIPVLAIAGGDSTFRLASGICGAIAVAAEGLQQTVQFQRLRIKIGAAYQLLMRESDLYLERAGRYSQGDQARRIFVEREEEIMETESTAWLSVQEKQRPSAKGLSAERETSN